MTERLEPASRPRPRVFRMPPADPEAAFPFAPAEAPVVEWQEDAFAREAERGHDPPSGRRGGGRARAGARHGAARPSRLGRAVLVGPRGARVARLRPLGFAADRGSLRPHDGSRLVRGRAPGAAGPRDPGAGDARDRGRFQAGQGGAAASGARGRPLGRRSRRGAKTDGRVRGALCRAARDGPRTRRDRARRDRDRRRSRPRRHRRSRVAAADRPDRGVRDRRGGQAGVARDGDQSTGRDRPDLRRGADRLADPPHRRTLQRQARAFRLSQAGALGRGASRGHGRDGGRRQSRSAGRRARHRGQALRPARRRRAERHADDPRRALGHGGLPPHAVCSGQATGRQGRGAVPVQGREASVQGRIGQLRSSQGTTMLASRSTAGRRFRDFPPPSPCTKNAMRLDRTARGCGARPASDGRERRRAP